MPNFKTPVETIELNTDELIRALMNVRQARLSTRNTKHCCLDYSIFFTAVLIQKKLCVQILFEAFPVQSGGVVAASSHTRLMLTVIFL